MKLKFDHIAIPAADLHSSGEFYKNVFGLEDIPTPGNNPKLRWFGIGGHTQLHLIKTEDIGRPKNKEQHYAFVTDQFDEVLNRLHQLNIPYGNFRGDLNAISERADGVRQVFFRDPNGHWLEINDASY
ncbi:VOC family protein [Aegicerativicinus sediminis]|uniref:VOC family protein n=1 Tax=Aegicerativicinus sediminis TaxID=2893202 RepID=UPI001E48910F|nr:VOC family protein [Aegicerativicinus sediminis]